MTIGIRSVMIAVLVGVGFVVAIPACADEGVGDPCTPEQEYDTTFNGFDEKEVNIESKSFQCRTRICLVNHFRGRVSCPYGQNSDGSPRYASPDSPACTVPADTTKPITLTISNDNDAMANFMAISVTGIAKCAARTIRPRCGRKTSVRP